MDGEVDFSESTFPDDFTHFIVLGLGLKYAYFNIVQNLVVDLGSGIICVSRATRSCTSQTRGVGFVTKLRDRG